MTRIWICRLKFECAGLDTPLNNFRESPCDGLKETILGSAGIEPVVTMLGSGKVLIRTASRVSQIPLQVHTMPDFKPGKVIRVAGPVIIADGMFGSQMYEVVRVGGQGLIGEIIRIEGDNATVQVYEETAGIRPGEAVERTGKPLSVELGPGITGQIYDGIQRPLTVLFEKTGPFVRRGIAPPPIDKSKKWHFVPVTKKGAAVIGGDIIGNVKETSLITQRIMIP